MHDSNSAEEILETEEISDQVDPQQLPQLIEALLFASGTPLTVKRICASTSYGADEVRAALNSIAQRLSDSGLELLEVAEGFQLRTRPEFGEYIQALKANRPRKLSLAAMETLAVIAYRQPVVKSDVETIRGVDATPTLKTLIDRGLIRIVGYQATAGQPALYGTTDRFLEIFGLKSLSELPSLRDLRELAEDPGEQPVEEQQSNEVGALTTA